MCDLCELYGEPEVESGVWYLNPKNYARQMYRRRATGYAPSGTEANVEAQQFAGTGAREALRAMEEGPEAWAAFQKQAAERRARSDGSQVVPIRDAEKIIDLCSPIGLMHCVCRKGDRGVEERSPEEYTCMGMGVGMLKWERWPERYKGGVYFVNPDEAKEWLWKCDKLGYVHALMTFGVPYIGGFCQCEYPACGIIRSRLDFGYGLRKSHYVALVDYDKCNGCGVCAQRCQFGALKFEVTIDKANIDPFQCFGCGLCETACPTGAIYLKSRMGIPALSGVW